nr:hypothetical protein CFP56_24352 [Quercus suber]
MYADEASAQLQSELQHAIHTALTTGRPILHHLNSDTTWFLQIPRPESAVRKNTRRHYYNILIDPWLAGGQSDVASWFSQQFHVRPSSVQTIAELETLACNVERAARGSYDYSEPDDDDGANSYIDAVAVSHEFTDHCHKDTLLEVPATTPVFAIKEAAALISSWKHFHTVVTVGAFGAADNTDWRATSLSPLPSWLGISRLLQRDDVLNYHSALLIAFNNQRALPPAVTTTSRKPRATIQPDEALETADALVYTPHGIHSGDLALIPQARPAVRTLAFLHGLHNVRVGTASGRTALQSNLGAHNGLKAQRLLQARYWIGTHDEVKTGGGLVAWFLQRDSLTLKDALEQERRDGISETSNTDLEKTVESFEGVNWVDLDNGESKVLV